MTLSDAFPPLLRTESTEARCGFGCGLSFGNEILVDLDTSLDLLEVCVGGVGWLDLGGGGGCFEAGADRFLDGTGRPFALPSFSGSLSKSTYLIQS